MRLRMISWDMLGSIYDIWEFDHKLRKDGSPAGAYRQAVLHFDRCLLDGKIVKYTLEKMS